MTENELAEMERANVKANWFPGELSQMVRVDGWDYMGEWPAIAEYTQFSDFSIAPGFVRSTKANAPTSGRVSVPTRDGGNGLAVPEPLPQAGAESDAGALGCLSLTGNPPSNVSLMNANRSRFECQTTPPELPAYQAGFDGGAEVSLYGHWFGGDVELRDKFFDRLDGLKNQASLTKNPVFLELEDGGEPWQVMGYGHNGGQKFRWTLRRGGVILWIHANPQGNIPGVRVKFCYDAIVRRDLVDVCVSVQTHLHKMGFQTSRDVVSRVDLQATVALPFRAFSDAFAEQRVVTKIRKWSTVTNGVEVESFTGGSMHKGVEICIYDKHAELMAKYDSDKFNFLEPLGENAEGLTRVEFRLRRPFLSLFEGLESVHDLQLHIRSLLDWLTNVYFRMLSEPKVRGRENLQPLSVEWLQVRECMFRAFCDGIESNRELSKRRPMDSAPERLVRQGLGSVVQAVVRYSFSNSSDPMSREEFYEYFDKLVKQYRAEAFKAYRVKFNAYAFERAETRIEIPGVCGSAVGLPVTEEKITVEPSRRGTSSTFRQSRAKTRKGAENGAESNRGGTVRRGEH